MKNSKFVLVITMLIFGSIGLFVRGINLTSSQIALVRGIIGSLFILVTAKVTGQPISWKRIKPNSILLVSSGIAIGFNWILLFEAYKYTTIANATLSYYFAPVFVILLSPIILKEKLSLVKVISILTALTGMFLIIGVNKITGSNHIIGITYGLTAAVLYAEVVIANKFIKNLSGMETTLMQLGIAAIILVPYVLITEGFEIVQLSGLSIGLLILIGILNTGVAYLLYFTAIKSLSSQTIAVFSYIDPISAIIMSGIIFGERMTYLQLMGGILILGSTFVSEIYENRVKIKSQHKLSNEIEI